MTDLGEAAPGDVAYRWSPWRFAIAMAVVGFAAAAAVSLLFSALAADLRFPPVSDWVLFVGVYTLFFAAFSVLFTRSRPPSLRFGGEGVELAAARRNAVWVPYRAVLSVQVRWMWPLSVLNVFVGLGDESQVELFDRGGRRPLRRQKGKRLRFSLPLAGLGASAATVRSELRSRHLAE